MVTLWVKNAFPKMGTLRLFGLLLAFVVWDVMAMAKQAAEQLSKIDPPAEGVAKQAGEQLTNIDSPAEGFRSISSLVETQHRSSDPGRVRTGVRIAAGCCGAGEVEANAARQDTKEDEQEKALHEVKTNLKVYGDKVTELYKHPEGLAKGRDVLGQLQKEGGDLLNGLSKLGQNSDGAMVKNMLADFTSTTKAEFGTINADDSVNGDVDRAAEANVREHLEGLIAIFEDQMMMNASTRAGDSVAEGQGDEGQAHAQDVQARLTQAIAGLQQDVEKILQKEVEAYAAGLTVDNILKEADVESAGQVTKEMVSDRLKQGNELITRLEEQETKPQEPHNAAGDDSAERKGSTDEKVTALKNDLDNAVSQLAKDVEAKVDAAHQTVEATSAGLGKESLAVGRALEANDGKAMEEGVEILEGLYNQLPHVGASLADESPATAIDVKQVGAALVVANALAEYYQTKAQQRDESQNVASLQGASADAMLGLSQKAQSVLEKLKEAKGRSASLLAFAYFRIHQKALAEDEAVSTVFEKVEHKDQGMLTLSLKKEGAPTEQVKGAAREALQRLAIGEGSALAKARAWAEKAAQALDHAQMEGLRPFIEAAERDIHKAIEDLKPDMAPERVVPKTSAFVEAYRSSNSAEVNNARRTLPSGDQIIESGATGHEVSSTDATPVEAHYIGEEHDHYDPYSSHADLVRVWRSVIV